MVILAAGASTRMKAIKQLLPWKKTTLLGHTIEQGLASKADSVYVVLGANKKEIAPMLQGYSVNIIINKDWAWGLGKSIACAVDFLENSLTEFDGVLIALADQPLLGTAYYNTLIAKFSERKCGIIATKQNTTIGVPAIFSRKYVGQLSLLNEDKGAKSIIKAHIDDVCEVNARGLALDIDTMEVYQKLSR